MDFLLLLLRWTADVAADTAIRITHLLLLLLL
jgi:hypothetical protein